MKYTGFFLENYRGVQDRLDFNLDMGSNVPHCIIGNNGSGKTTILEGIELISHLCEGRVLDNGARQAIRPKGDYFSGVAKLGASLSCPQSTAKSDERIAKYVEGSGDVDISFEFAYEFKSSAFVPGSNKVSIKINQSLVIDDEDKNAIFNLLKIYAPDVIYYDDFKFAVPNTIRFLATRKTTNDTAYLESSENRHWQQIFTDILKGHDPDNADSFQKDVVDWSTDPSNDPFVAEDRMRGMGRYLDELLKEWIEDNKNNIQSFQVSKKNQLANDLEKVLHDYQLRIVSDDISYKMDERSKGLQWSFCFHILTSIRKNRHKAGFIFLLDEPANNLHIRPQNEMLKHLNDLCKDNSSVIYSTHSPELIGTNEECYKHTFIAKNDAAEFSPTNILLYKLTEADSKVDVKDIEPILAKLAYADIKNLADVDNADDKEKWRSIIGAIKDPKKLEKLAQTSTIANFILNTIPRLFG